MSNLLRIIYAMIAHTIILRHRVYGFHSRNHGFLTSRMAVSKTPDTGVTEPGIFIGYSIPEDPAGHYLNPESWKCTMIWSAYMGLPLSLEGVGAVLKLQNQKLKEGKDLIRYFCTPCKPTKANGGRTRNLPQHDSEKWMRFKKYNLRDVEVEMAVKKRLAKYPVLQIPVKRSEFSEMNGVPVPM